MTKSFIAVTAAQPLRKKGPFAWNLYILLLASWLALSTGQLVQCPAAACSSDVSCTGTGTCTIKFNSTDGTYQCVNGSCQNSAFWSNADQGLVAPLVLKCLAPGTTCTSTTVAALVVCSGSTTKCNAQTNGWGAACSNGAECQGSGNMVVDASSVQSSAGSGAKCTDASTGGLKACNADVHCYKKQQCTVQANPDGTYSCTSGQCQAISAVTLRVSGSVSYASASVAGSTLLCDGPTSCNAWACRATLLCTASVTTCVDKMPGAANVQSACPIPAVVARNTSTSTTVTLSTSTTWTTTTTTVSARQWQYNAAGLVMIWMPPLCSERTGPSCVSLPVGAPPVSCDAGALNNPNRTDNASNPCQCNYKMPICGDTAPCFTGCSDSFSLSMASNGSAVCVERTDAGSMWNMYNSPWITCTPLACSSGYTLVQGTCKAISGLASTSTVSTVTVTATVSSTTASTTVTSSVTTTSTVTSTVSSTTVTGTSTVSSTTATTTHTTTVTSAVTTTSIVTSTVSSTTVTGTSTVSSTTATTTVMTTVTSAVTTTSIATSTVSSTTVTGTSTVSSTTATTTVTTTVTSIATTVISTNTVVSTTVNTTSTGTATTSSTVVTTAVTAFVGTGTVTSTPVTTEVIPTRITTAAGTTTVSSPRVTIAATAVTRTSTGVTGTTTVSGTSVTTTVTAVIGTSMASGTSGTMTLVSLTRTRALTTSAPSTTSRSGQIVIQKVTNGLANLTTVIEGLSAPNATYGAAAEGQLNGLMRFVLSSSSTQVMTVTSGTREKGIELRAAALPIFFSTTGKMTSVPLSGLPPNFPLAQELPAEAILQAAQALGSNFTGQSFVGLTSCLWTGINPYGPANITDPVTNETQVNVDPVGKGVSLSLTDANGSIAVVQGLTLPIIIAVPVHLTQARKIQDDVERELLGGTHLSCRWFNETTLSWMGDGCKLMSLRNDGEELLCACTHLTTFAAFPTPISMFLNLSMVAIEFLFDELVICGHFDTLFSQEGLLALVNHDNDWPNRLSTGWWYALISFVGLCFMASFCRDMYSSKDLHKIWAEIDHIIPPFSASAALKRTWHFLRSPSLWLRGIVRDTIEAHMALQLSVCQGTLQTLHEVQHLLPGALSLLEDKEDGRPGSSFEKRVLKASRELEECKLAVIQDLSLTDLPVEEGDGLLKWTLYLARRLAKLLFKTVAAGHAASFLCQRDLWTFQSHRALVLTVQFLGSIFCSALYFKQSGIALTPDVGPECFSADFGTKVATAIPVSIVSALLGTGAASAFYNMITARPKGNGARRLSEWLCHGLWFIGGFSVSTFYLIFLAAFLANVHEQSAELWVLSAWCSLASSLIVSPLCVALFYLTVTVVALQKAPGLAWRSFAPLQEPQTTSPVQQLEARHVVDKEKPLEASQGSVRTKKKKQPIAVVDMGGCHLPGQLVEEHFTPVTPFA